MQRYTPLVVYDPELYRLVHRGTPGDVAFYQRGCAGADSVLELGCGWGRVLSNLRAPERLVAGLDAHPGLLAMARAELPPEVQLAEGDMAAFALQRGFERIVIPHSGLWCLADQARVASCLACVRRHLKPGGLVAFDAWNADGFHAQADPWDQAPDDLQPLVTITAGNGCDFDVLERSLWDRDAQRIDVTYVYLPHDGGDPREETLTHHYLRRAQIERLARDAGLDIRSVAGGFRGERWGEDAEHLIVVAQRRR